MLSLSVAYRDTDEDQDLLIDKPIWQETLSSIGPEMNIRISKDSSGAFSATSEKIPIGDQGDDDSQESLAQ